MKKLLLAFLLLFVSVRAFASNVIAQSPAAATYSNSTTATKAYPANLTPGSLLVAVVTSDGPNSVSSITVADGTNGAWTQAAAATSPDNGSFRGVIYYFANNASTGQPTVTATISAASYGVIQIYEITGAPTSSPVDTSGTYNDRLSLPSIALSAAANSTIIASLIKYDPTTPPDSGYTLDYSPTAQYNSYATIEHIADAGGAGTKTLTMNDTQTPGNAVAFVAVAFKSSCTADHLTYTAQPSNAILSATLGTVAVAVKDSGGNTCTSNNSTSVTLSENGSSTWGVLHSSSNLTKTVTAGVSTWTDLYVDTATGSGSIDAAASGLTGATSTSITISATGGAKTMSMMGVGQ